MENELTVSNWSAMKEQASMLVKSGMIPISINTPEKAIAIAITAKELGIGMMEGFRSINVIQGKPTISPQLMLALANRTGKLKDIKIDSNSERCIVTVEREGRSPHTEEFGVKEATSLGLIGKDNYIKQRATMLKWRCLAAALRVTFPDVMLGFYTPEEMGADVKVTDTEEMEVVSTGEMVNTGVRVPKDYWDLPTPEEKQARIGDGNSIQKTEKGWFIFTPKASVEAFEASLPKKEEKAPQIEQQAPKEALITHTEQLEIFRLVKEKKIHHLTFKKALKDEFGCEGTARISKELYPRIIEWLMKFESAEVGN